MTRWSLVRQACGGDEESATLEALQEVCLNYWFPLYAWARHSHWPELDAQDLIQSFFEQLLEKGFLKSADPNKGRLRTFLLTCLKRHAGDLKEKAHAAKRDARRTVSLDFEWAEGRFHEHQADTESPDKLYDRRWAHTLLRYALEALRRELESDGKAAEYGILKPFLGFEADEADTYRTAAQQLAISEAAVKSRVFRLRKRFNELVKAQATLTLGKDLSAKDELLELMAKI